jgi:ABC-type ribose transport system, auxiliary component
MKRTGLLHPQLAGLVAGLGHGQLLTIADAGLPIDPRTQRVELAVRCGMPSFADVLEAIATELVVERVIVARESADVAGAPLEAALVAAFRDQQPARETVDHERLKQLADASVAVVRTGECTPYMNVVLVAGVGF